VYLCGLQFGPYSYVRWFFRDQPKPLAAAGAALFRFGQIMHNTFALKMPGQRLAPAALLAAPPLLRCPGARGRLVEIIIASAGFFFRVLRPPGDFEQFRLLFGQLLVFARLLCYCISRLRLRPATPGVQNISLIGSLL
jgi:hypothetical protein